MLLLSSPYLTQFAPFSLRAARNFSCTIFFASSIWALVAPLMVRLVVLSSFLIIARKYVSNPGPPYSLMTSTIVPWSCHGNRNWPATVSESSIASSLLLLQLTRTHHWACQIGSSIPLSLPRALTHQCLFYCSHICGLLLACFSTQGSTGCRLTPTRSPRVIILVTPVFVHKKEFLFLNSQRSHFIHFVGNSNHLKDLIIHILLTWRCPSLALWQWISQFIRPKTSKHHLVIMTISELSFKNIHWTLICSRKQWLKHNDSSFKILGAASNLSFSTIRKHIHLHEFSARWKPTSG